ncbi:MAG: dockerin type I repeat-containing protein [Clostridia bacterium]|nr:dockerin type I repeat-containing protein [Clostridia bacterium]MBR6619134.1 dockerin type I repeat-containing protein [Clostridia bacterium]
MKIKKILSVLLIVAAIAGVCTVSFAANNKMGDVDFDSLVTAEDALLVLRYTAGTDELTAQQLKVADVTYDGKVNSVDALRILLYVSGSVPSLERIDSEEGDDIII